MVKVSVIMPNKNNERWLKKSIESVINQTYKNWELIIVDDHSTDRSPEIIREHMNRDDRVVGIFDPDEPFPLTRNIGIEVSSGRYILFLDSDDWISPKLLEDALLNFKGVDGYASSYKVITSTGWERSFVYERGVYPSGDGLKVRYRFGNGNSVLKRSIIENYGIKFPPFRYSEDTYFYYFYLSVTRRIFVSDLLGFTNNRMGSTVVSGGSYERKLLETMKSYELLFSRLKEQGFGDKTELIQKYGLPRSIVTYLDSTPRHYKFRVFLKYFRVLIPYILFKRCGSGECLWAYATMLDSIVPVKWLLRKLKTP